MILVLLVHGLFILTSLTLLVYAIWCKGRKRKVLALAFIIVFGTYSCSLILDFYENSKIEKNFVGMYQLTNYKNCDNCILQLSADNSYKIYSESTEYENGNWGYDDDGDHSYVKFANGGELGVNEYQFENRR